MAADGSSVKSSEKVLTESIINKFNDVINLAPSRLEYDETVCMKLQSELKALRKSKKKNCMKRISLSCLVFKLLPSLTFLGLLFIPISMIAMENQCLLSLGPFSEVLGTDAMGYDCTFCEGVTYAPRLSNLTVEEFVERYAYTTRPIIVTDATELWTAKDVFSYEYFKELYVKNKLSLEADVEGYQFFGYSSMLETLNDFFNMSKERVQLQGNKRWYIGWSTGDAIIGGELRKHFSPPYFIPPQPKNTPNVSWIFMGAPGQGAYIHVDSVDLTSWQAQLKGKKTWILIPPPECEAVCMPFNATMETGDMIVVDTNVWFHGTYIHPGEISITIGSEFM